MKQPGAKPAWQQLVELVEGAGATIRFGLRQQGHIPQVEFMLAMGATWDEIERSIGWNSGAAKQWYEYDIEAIPRTVRHVRDTSGEE